MSCCDCKLKGLYEALKTPFIPTQLIRTICEMEKEMKPLRKGTREGKWVFSEETQKQMREDIKVKEKEVLVKRNQAIVIMKDNLANVVVNYLINTNTEMVK